ncbi:MAG: hypothetical protein IKP32_03935 [Clostridia bacterium]|nr:hypothetical protein [Clostridia bacterium]
MSEGAFELLALLMRYVYVLIGVLILWRALRWMRRDAKAYKKEMKSLPDAGLVGEMVNLKTGQAQPLPREGIIGSSRACDIRVKSAGVRRIHARFEFMEGKGLCVVPCWRCRVILSGTEVKGRGYALHGTQLQLGGAQLRVRLFAGLKIPHPAYPEDVPPQQEVAVMPWSEVSQLPLFPMPADSLDQDGEADYMPYSAASLPVAPEAPMPYPPADYEGNYTEDGQMTWQYAYSLEELRQAQENYNQQNDEAVPYQSPLPRRRRRSRHE